MHQLAVVGGGRNANGVPGVFGPADGRGQSCMAFSFKFTKRLRFCVCFYGPKRVCYKQKGSPVLYQLALYKNCCFLMTYLSKNQSWSKSKAKEISRQTMLVKRIYNWVYQSTIQTWFWFIISRPISPNDQFSFRPNRPPYQLGTSGHPMFACTLYCTEWVNTQKYPSCYAMLDWITLHGASFPTQHYAVRKLSLLCK